MEYRCNNFNDQHKHGRHLFRNCDGYQGLHGLWFRHFDRQSKPHGFGE
jgi:hypothetical protein